MVYVPRTLDAIKSSIEDNLKNQISKLTNFTDTSFNTTWNEAFSQRFRDNEEALLAVQLNGWVSYAGGPVSQDDLDVLGVSDNVDPEDVNEYMSDDDLDNLVQIVGLDRDEGDFADGTVTFTTTSDTVTIPGGEDDGTIVGTQPDSDGDFFEYRVIGPDEDTEGDVSPSTGNTTVDAYVVAEEVGTGKNVGSGTVTYLPDPPSGVTDVTNNNAFTGGTDRETNDELRQRAKEAIFNTSGGGTAEGVKGFVDSNTEDVASVAVKEYPGGNDSLSSDSPSPGGPGGSTSTAPFADVIVEGGSNTEVQESIDQSRPVAVQHNLVRPTFINVDVTADVTGSDVNVSDAESALQSYIDALDLGEDVVRDKVIQRIMNADADIDGISSLTVAVDGEVHTYDSDNSGGDAPNHPLYKLNKGDSMTSDGITEVTGTLSGSAHTFVEDTDYQEGTVDGSSPDAIDWGLAGDNPDEDTDFQVTYNISDDMPVDDYEKAESNTMTVNTV